jgi:acylphosphatase
LKAQELGLVGWVKNTKHDTVIGEAQGESDKLTKMYHKFLFRESILFRTRKEWLSSEGSPQSKITNCKCEEIAIEKYTFSSFEVIRGQGKG